MIEVNQIYNEDSIIGMQRIPDQSIDVILIDPPYNVLQDTTETWDKDVWDMPQFAEQANRILKDNGYLFTFGMVSFFHNLMMHTDNFFRIHFDLVWVKPNSVNFHMCNIKPMNQHEQILCLIKHVAKPRSMTYNYRDIGSYGTPYKVKRGRENRAIAASMSGIYTTVAPDGFRYPKTVIECYSRSSMPFDERTEHPTQKPLKLVEYIILGFSNKGDTIFDGFLGSGTTAIACINTNRNYIGFEIDKNYFDIAQQRIKDAKKQLRLF